jgi:NCS1 family nucleobase:cation symporter-1
VPAHTAIAFMVFWLIQVAIILKGTEGIKLLEAWSAPLLLAGGLLLLLWAIRVGGGLGPLLAGSERLRGSGNSFGALFPSALTASVGYWATLSLNIPTSLATRKASAPRCWARRWGCRRR